MTIARAISGKASFGLLQELDFVTDDVAAATGLSV